MVKRIAILGSTGSIGKSALQVINSRSKDFSVAALSAYEDISSLSSQTLKYRPAMICIGNDQCRPRSALYKWGKAKVLFGQEGLNKICRDPRIDHVLLAISGAAALYPLLSALQAGKEVSSANKEALVMAGPLVMRTAKDNHVRIIPIDSEQSAIWQCLQGNNVKDVKRIYLTASGGPFRNLPLRDFKRISLKQALRHPRWKMGTKITIDSATLMNKGLEVLEAMYLFGLQPGQIKVVVHPQSVIHSMVEFVDGSIIAQLSRTDMRIPIHYALSFPLRSELALPGLDIFKSGPFTFEEPDIKRFPCLHLALRAARTQDTMPAVMNAANEVSVEAFLEERISFMDIPKIVESVMDKHHCVSSPRIIDIFAADTWARRQALQQIRSYAC